MLLWSMRRLSLDSRVFSSEFPQLLFNFTSFQTYEILLVATAAFLASRRVWYDSGLLVGLENLFVCVPFLLVSQALLLNNQTAFGLCVVGGAFAIFRVLFLKRRVPSLNMPPSLLTAGGVVLAFNLAWPILIRGLHQDRNRAVWDDLGLTLNGLEWNWIIPALIAFAFLIPTRRSAFEADNGEEAPFYTWACFPVVALLLWSAGTAVHLYCIGYVYDLPWDDCLLIPAIWMGAWALWRHAGAFGGERHRQSIATTLLVAPALVAVATPFVRSVEAGVILSLLNCAIYGAIGWSRRDRTAWQLAALSFLVGWAFAPHPLVVHTIAAPLVNPVAAVFGSALAYAICWAIFSRNAKLGILGGLCLALGVIAILPKSITNLNVAVQLGFMFILLHSLRWNAAQHPEAATARNLCAAYWLVHTLFWVAAAPARALAPTIACGAATVVIYCVTRVILGQWGPRVIIFSGLAVTASAPASLALRWLFRAPDGVLMLLGSFALFGLGTVAALMKKRWMRRGEVCMHSNEITTRRLPV